MSLSEEELEKLACAELLKNAKRRSELAKTIGVAAWSRRPSSVNKRFLQNTLLNTLPSRKRPSNSSTTHLASKVKADSASSSKSMEIQHPDPFSLKTFCLITGASRGIGLEIAEKFGNSLASGSVICLHGRNAELLEKQVKALNDKQKERAIAYIFFIADLALSEDYAHQLQSILRNNAIHTSQFQQALLVQNAGSLGTVSKIAVDLSSQDTQDYYTLNVSSCILLNSAFCEIFPKNSVSQRIVINLSSLCAVQPMTGFSLYCSGKAARDMLFQVFALENEDIRVLNYAPGPIDTDMNRICREETACLKSRKMFQDIKASKNLLSTSTTVAKLISILKANSFKSGSHVDYYDV